MTLLQGNRSQSDRRMGCGRSSGESIVHPSGPARGCIWFNDFVNQFSFAGGGITSFQKENMEQQRISLGMTYRPTVSVAFTAAYERNQRIQGSTLIFQQVLRLGRVPDKTYDALVLGTSVSF